MQGNIYPALLRHPLKKSGIYPVTGVILAGGKSKRFGGKIDKTFLLLENKSLIQRVIEKISSLVEEIIIVTNEKEKFSQFPLRIVSDVYPGYGALSGLHSGLYYAKNFYSFVCACDSPFLRPELVTYLIEKEAKYDVVIPWLKNGQQPFCARYSKNCIQPIEDLIKKQKNTKIIDFFGEVNVGKIDEEKIIKIDSQLISFFNINTWDDFKQAEILLRRE